MFDVSAFQENCIVLQFFSEILDRDLKYGRKRRWLMLLPMNLLRLVVVFAHSEIFTFVVDFYNYLSVFSCKTRP